MITTALCFASFLIGFVCAVASRRTGSAWRTEPAVISENEGMEHVRIRVKESWSDETHEARFTCGDWGIAKMRADNNPDDVRAMTRKDAMPLTDPQARTLRFIIAQLAARIRTIGHDRP